MLLLLNPIDERSNSSRSGKDISLKIFAVTFLQLERFKALKGLFESDSNSSSVARLSESVN